MKSSDTVGKIDLRRRKLPTASEGRAGMRQEGDGGHVEADNASEERHQSKGNSFMLPVLMLVSILMLSLAARTTFRMVQRSWNKNQKTNMIFSPEELARYDGIKTNGRILLAIMGSVYDVSRGRRFYGPKGSYSFFAGRDASRSFVTGKFKEDLNDEVKDFTPEQHASLLHWKTFFENNAKYPFLGRVIGAFYDETGSPKPALIMSEMKAQMYNDNKQKKKKDQHPPCKIKWSKEHGGKVYCVEGQYPRRVLDDQAATSLKVKETCSCFPTPEATESILLYPGCSKDSSSCQTSSPK